MAYDKVVDSSALDAGLKSIADAIREKAGTSDNLAFPTAMAAAIKAIEAGGSKFYSMSITPAEDLTVYKALGGDLQHNLGVVPNFYYIHSDIYLLESPNTNKIFSHYVLVAKDVNDKSTYCDAIRYHSSETNLYFYTSVYFNCSAGGDEANGGYIITEINRGGNDQKVTATETYASFSIRRGETYYKLIGGITYTIVVGEVHF